MRYKEVKIKVSPEQLDPLILLLAQRDITGLIINDPREADELMASKETWHWDYVDEDVLFRLKGEASVTFYLDQNAEVESLLAGLNGYDVEVCSVDDQDWLHKWKEYFIPVRITPRIVVKPAWSEYSAEEDDIVIEIDPGLAFGTGTHPTTKLCLLLMEKYLSVGDSVLDVGSGTGILSVGAALLGSGRVLAVDLDPEAVKSTAENARLNGVADIVEARRADLTKGLHFSADIVVSNLMADLVVMLSKSVSKHLKGKAIYISSGILCEKEAFVRESLEAAGFLVEEVLYEEEWCAIAARRV